VRRARGLRVRLTVGRVVAILAAFVALGACTSAAVPVASTATALPTASPSVTATASPSPTPSPSPSVAIVKITPIPGAPDSGTTLELVARGAKWDQTKMTAPAGKIWHVKVESKDTLGHHNFVVASGKTFPERIYTSKNLLPLTTVTYDIPALPAGSYLFICTVHPDSMTGTLTLE
jgi:plastocyanin